MIQSHNIMPFRIVTFLESKNIPYELIELQDIAFTVDDVLRLSDGKLLPEEVCKTIIVHGRKTGTLHAILLRGEDKLHFTKLKKLLGEEVAIASAEEVKQVSGVDPGAVCPFLLTCPLLVEERVLELSTFNCGSGEHLYGLECTVADLEKGVSYQVADMRK